MGSCGSASPLCGAHGPALRTSLPCHCAWCEPLCIYVSSGPLVLTPPPHPPERLVPQSHFSAYSRTSTTRFSLTRCHNVHHLSSMDRRSPRDPIHLVWSVLVDLFRLVVLFSMLIIIVIPPAADGDALAREPPPCDVPDGSVLDHTPGAPLRLRAEDYSHGG